LEAAHRDFNAGLLFDTESRVRVDVLDDFMDQTEFLLEERLDVPATSLAGAILEDTLRIICDRHSISYPDKTKIDALNRSLASAKVYDKLVQKQITSYADMRNNADHGHFDKIRHQDVEDILKWLKRFVTDHLST